VTKALVNGQRTQAPRPGWGKRHRHTACDTPLVARGVHFYGQHFRVASEVRISRKDRPVTPYGDGAEESVNYRDGDSFCPACVPSFRSLLVVHRVEDSVGKRTEVGAELFVLFHCF